MDEEGTKGAGRVNTIICSSLDTKMQSRRQTRAVCVQHVCLHIIYLLYTPSGDVRHLCQLYMRCIS